jgi:glycosyltransferase involved in cell wall biosynthesis
VLTDGGNVHELAVVMPAYNEEDCIASVVREWRTALAAAIPDFVLIVLDDGSTDGTAAVLSAFAGDNRISVVSKRNEGHGPTILRGYRTAVSIADWVFQVDTDDEIPARDFALLWERREEYDALIGSRRASRRQDVSRWVVSAISRLVVRVLYGGRVADVNAPFRLVRSRILAPIIEAIPEDTFAPNLLISGALSRGRIALTNVPVQHVDRRTGTVSIARFRLLRAAARSLAQTVRSAPAIRRVARTLHSSVLDTTEPS